MREGKAVERGDGDCEWSKKIQVVGQNAYDHVDRDSSGHDASSCGVQGRWTEPRGGAEYGAVSRRMRREQCQGRWHVLSVHQAAVSRIAGRNRAGCRVKLYGAVMPPPSKVVLDEARLREFGQRLFVRIALAVVGCVRGPGLVA